MPPRREDKVIRVTAATPVRCGRPHGDKQAAPPARRPVLDPAIIQDQIARRADLLKLCATCPHYDGPEITRSGVPLCDYMRDARTGLYPCPGRFDRLLRRGGPRPGPDCLWPSREFESDLTGVQTGLEPGPAII